MKIWYDENAEKKKIERNVYLRKLKENDRLRMILSAVPGTAGNIIFALMNGGIGLIVIPHGLEVWQPIIFF